MNRRGKSSRRHGGSRSLKCRHGVRTCRRGQCETRDLSSKWPLWHTLICEEQVKVDMRVVLPAGGEADAAEASRGWSI